MNFGKPYQLSVSIIAVILLLPFLYSCAGSPVRILSSSHEENKQFVRSKTTADICERIKKAERSSKESNSEMATKAYNEIQQAVFEILEERGLHKNYCDDPEHYEYLASVEINEYNIDLLEIITVQEKETSCSSGGIYKIFIKGIISPDSSFALDKILQESPPCRDKSNNIIEPVEVHLESSGGLLDDGYLMGNSLRMFAVKSVVDSGKVCASSCAVAFLGGSSRVVDDLGTIVFHAPYSINNRYPTKSASAPNCNIGKNQLVKLKDYYIKMVGKDSGERLYDRTMWYCSASDGWTISGPNAARLYQIATN